MTDGSFADAFERLRVGRGLSPAELARELDEYEGNVSRWRRGKRIDLLKVWKVADFFGVDRGWLQGLAGYPVSSIATAEDAVDLGKAEWNALYDRMAPDKRATVIPMVRAAANTSDSPAATPPGARINSHRGRQQPPIKSQNRGLAGLLVAICSLFTRRQSPALIAATA